MQCKFMLPHSLSTTCRNSTQNLRPTLQTDFLLRLEPQNLNCQGEEQATPFVWEEESYLVAANPSSDNLLVEVQRYTQLFVQAIFYYNITWLRRWPTLHSTNVRQRHRCISSTGKSHFEGRTLYQQADSSKLPLVVIKCCHQVPPSCQVGRHFADSITTSSLQNQIDFLRLAAVLLWRYATVQEASDLTHVF